MIRTASKAATLGLAGKVTVRGLVFVGCAVWSLVAIWPFVAMVLLGFRNTEAVFAHPLGIGGRGWTIANYIGAWNGAPGTAAFRLLAWHSVQATFPAVVIAVGAGFLAAYGLSRLRALGGRRALRVFVMGGVIPFALLIIPLFEICNILGLLNNPLAVGVLFGIVMIPSSVLLFYGRLVDFPAEMLDAAAVDGASQSRVLWSIVVPMSRGILAAVGVIAFLSAWGEAQLAVALLSAPSGETLPVAALTFQDEYGTNLAGMYAMLAMMTVPVILLYLAFNRTVLRSISLAGVFR